MASKRLQKELNGQIEVENNGGFIDVLTDTQIIEIKNSVSIFSSGARDSIICLTALFRI